MQKTPIMLGKLLILFALLFIPSWAMANNLTIVDVETPEEGSPTEKARLSVYFDYRQGENNMAITGINADNCSVNIDGRTPEVVRAEVREFTSGNRGVGVLFVFPIAKNYLEESFAIRSTLTTLVQNMNRDIDMVNAIPYDSNATPLGWSRASEGSLSRQIGELKTTDVLEPNLFTSFHVAVNVLANLQNVSQKYVVIISDAEGAVVGDREQAMRYIGNFVDALKKNDIKPIVVGYSPDGAAAMNNVDLIKRIATNAGGAFFRAESLTVFQQVLQRDVYDYIFKQYIYDVTLNMTGDNYLEPDKSAVKVTWPMLEKNRTWLWITLVCLFLAGAGVVVFIVIRRRNQDDDEFIDEGPQEVVCSTCGKPIPQQLFGFKGEFCLSGGLPDCPYYQMPDRGKIQITKGAMADTTFFIKKEMTTIGSYPDSDIFLADKSVSRKHSAIKADEGNRYEIRDFGSANGVYINNEKIQRKFLKDGDLIRFGTVETVFKLK